VANFAGHYLKIVAFYLVYRALVVTGLQHPYDLLFRDLVERTDALRRSEQQLEEANRKLETRVADRTDQLGKRTAQLQAMALELTQAEQRERRRLAQVLHDHLQQLLSAAKLKTSLMRAKLQDPELTDAVRHLEDMIDESIDASRSLAYELSPPVLHELGLAPALEWLCEWMYENHGLTVDSDLDDVPGVEELNVFLFQASREILFNVVKHAEVDRARLHLTLSPDGELCVTIEDEGKGFDPNASADGGALGGFGLFGIRERIDLLGGRFEIDAAPGRGCCFRLLLPLPAENDGTADSTQ
jgi:signal transduction histidine kinase